MLDSLPVLDLLEELNVAVVDDLLCHESMQFRTPYPRRGDRGLQAGLPVPGPEGASPSMSPRSPGGKWLAQLAKARGADAVYFCLMKFCDPEAFDYPLVKKDLEEAGVPLLSVEHDQLVESTEQLRTRIQGFWRSICPDTGQERSKFRMYLGLDIGSSSSKVVLLGRQGRS